MVLREVIMEKMISVKPKSGGSVLVNTPSRSIEIKGVMEVQKSIYEKYLVGLVDIVIPAPEKIVVKKRENKETVGGE
jgi:hypothetical protein